MQCSGPRCDRRGTRAASRSTAGRRGDGDLALAPLADRDRPQRHHDRAARPPGAVLRAPARRPRSRAAAPGSRRRPRRRPPADPLHRRRDRRRGAGPGGAEAMQALLATFLPGAAMEDFVVQTTSSSSTCSRAGSGRSSRTDARSNSAPGDSATYRLRGGTGTRPADAISLASMRRIVRSDQVSRERPFRRRAMAAAAELTCANYWQTARTAGSARSRRPTRRRCRSSVTTPGRRMLSAP